VCSVFVCEGTQQSGVVFLSYSGPPPDLRNVPRARPRLGRTPPRGGGESFGFAARVRLFEFVRIFGATGKKRIGKRPSHSDLPTKPKIPPNV